MFLSAFVVLVAFFQAACYFQGGRCAIACSASVFTVLFLYQKQSKCDALSINSDLACVGSQRALGALSQGLEMDEW